MDGDLQEDNSTSVRASPSPKIIGYFPLLQTIRCSTRSLSCTSIPSSRLFLPWTSTSHFHVASVQRKLVTPTSILSAPPASSPSPDTNGGTDLQVFDASNC